MRIGELLPSGVKLVVHVRNLPVLSRQVLPQLDDHLLEPSPSLGYLLALELRPRLRQLLALRLELRDLRLLLPCALKLLLGRSKLRLSLVARLCYFAQALRLLLRGPEPAARIRKFPALSGQVFLQLDNLLPELSPYLGQLLALDLKIRELRLLLPCVLKLLLD